MMAEEYGLPVFPCDATKKPITAHGFKDASRSITIISDWWDLHPDALVGMPTGKVSGVFVVDIDPAGVAWYTANAERLACGFVQQTRRGFHLYYKLPPDLEVRNSTSQIAPGVDVRGEGGYVIVWGAHGLPAVGSWDDIAPAPAWLLAALRKPTNGSDVKPRGTADGPAVGEGQRNAYLSREAFRLRKQGRSVEQIVVALDALNRSVCTPPLDDGEVRTIAAGKRDVTPEDTEAERPGFRLELVPYGGINISDIPPRQFLFGRHYIRGFTSCDAGAPGAAKSTLQIVEAVSMVLGRDLLTGRPLPVGTLRVWLHNAEDPQVELDRRIAGILIRYRLSWGDLGGRLFVTSGRDVKITLASALREQFVLHVPVANEIIRECKDKRIDVVTLDPFVLTHEVPENHNGLIAATLREYNVIADAANAALNLTHHVRKANGIDVTVDDVRGASAIIGGCRSVRLIAPMSPTEAQAADIDRAERFRYVSIANGKANMAPRAEQKDWFHLESVNLANARPPYPADEVAVAETWNYPACGGIEPSDLPVVLAALRTATDPLNHCRVAPQSKHWAGHLVADTLELDVTAEGTRDRIRDALAYLTRKGSIRQTVMKCPVKRRDVPVYEVPNDA